MSKNVLKVILFIVFDGSLIIELYRPYLHSYSTYIGV